MKKIRLKQSAVALLASVLTVGAGVAIAPSARSVQAATQTNTALDDNFNALTGQSDWSTNSYEPVRKNYSLSLANNSYRAWAGLSKYKVDGDCSIGFKVSAHGEAGGWFGLQLGHSGFSEETGLAGAMIVSYDGADTRLMDHGDGSTTTLSNGSVEENAVLRGQNALSIGKSGVACVQVDLVRRDPDAANGKDAGGRVLYDIDYYLWKEGDAKPASPSISWEKGVGADGYIGFGGMMPSQYVRIYDFKIEENGQTAFDAAFDLDIDNQVGFGADNNWRLFETTTENVFIAADTYIDTKDVSAGLLLNKSQLTVDPYCKKQFELAFDVDCAALAKNASFGAGFGLAPSSTAVDERNYIGIQGGADGAWKFVMAYGGRVRRTSAQYEDYLTGMQRFTVEGYYDGSVTVTFGGKSETFKDLDLEGNFALGTIGTVASNAKFDNVLLTVTKRVSPKTKAEDRLIDFTGKQVLEEDGYTYETKYIDESKWYLGNSVRAARDGGDYIQFANANGASVFGPRNRYEEFICRFSVTVSQNRDVAPNGAKIGVSFGRRAFHTDNAADPAVFFEKTTRGMQMRIYNASCDIARGGVVALDGLDFWSSEDVASSPVTYRVMIVVRGGAANVYCAAATAPDSEMSVLRARLDGFESYGFVAAAGRDGATFRLNDLSVVNTAITR